MLTSVCKHANDLSTHYSYTTTHQIVSFENINSFAAYKRTIYVGDTRPAPLSMNELTKYLKYRIIQNIEILEIKQNR